MGASPFLWANRHAAGLELATLLQRWADQPQTTTVIGLPRGGVAVAAAVAQTLHLPLGSWAVRKLATPLQPEYAVGALAAGGVVVWNQEALAADRISPHEQQQLVAAASTEVERRQQRYGQLNPNQLQGRRLIVVDDGIATGMTVRAALQALRQRCPAELVLAVPVLDRRLVEELKPLVDALVAVVAVDNLEAVGAFYADFSQLSDDDVITLLGESNANG